MTELPYLPSKLMANFMMVTSDSVAVTPPPPPPPVYSGVNYLNSLKFTTERIIFFLNESQWIMTMLLGASEKDAYRGGVTKPGFSWVIFELLKIILIINMVV